MKFSVYRESRVGGRRSNQDRLAYRYSRKALLLLVADGMGGYAHGDVAAQVAVDHLVDAFERHARPAVDEPFGFLADGFNGAHAAIGRVQLGKLAGWTAQRQANAAYLTSALDNVVTPSIASGATHVFHQYTIRIPGHDQDAFAAALVEKGVGCGVYYPTPVHELPSFGLTIDLPETKRAAKEVISLPVHPALSEDDLETIALAVNAVAKAGA